MWAILQFSLSLFVFIQTITGDGRITVLKDWTGGKQVVVLNITQCQGHPDLAVFIPPMKIIQEGKNDYFIDGEIIFKQDFLNGFSVNVTAKKCETPDEDACIDLFSNLKTNDLCTLLAPDTVFYSSFLRSTVPPLKCPLKHGIMKVPKFPVENTILKFLPGKPAYFRVTGTGYLRNKEVACFYLGLYTRSKRTRN